VTRLVGINHVALEVGDVEGALAGMELDLGKTEAALAELRAKGLA
jgi:hypothetical protein